MNKYKWSIETIENMICWERDIYLNLVIGEEERRKHEAEMNQYRGKF